MEQNTKTEEAAKTRGKLIRELLEKIEKDFKVKEAKVTLADYIRLTQLEREIDVRLGQERIHRRTRSSMDIGWCRFGNTSSGIRDQISSNSTSGWNG